MALSRLERRQLRDDLRQEVPALERAVFYYGKIGDRRNDKGEIPFWEEVDSDSHLFATEERLSAHLLDICNGYMDQSGMELVHKSLALALSAHQSQYRDSKVPYSLHVLKVASSLAKSHQQDPVTISSALLHDVIEDKKFTKVAIARIHRDISSEVADTVEALSKIRGRYLRKDIADAKNMIQVIGSLLENSRVAIIKIDDRLHGLRTLKYKKSRIKQLSIIQETQAIYIPLAKRLGLTKEVEEMENLCLEQIDERNIVKAKKLRQFRKQRVSSMKFDHVDTKLQEHHNFDPYQLLPHEIFQLTNLAGITLIDITNPSDYQAILLGGENPQDSEQYVDLNVDIIMPEFSYGSFPDLDPLVRRRAWGEKAMGIANKLSWLDDYYPLEAIDEMSFRDDIEADAVDSLSIRIKRISDGIRMQINIYPLDAYQLKTIPMTWKYVYRDVQYLQKDIEMLKKLTGQKELADQKLTMLNERYSRIIDLVKEGGEQYTALLRRILEPVSLAGFTRIIGINDEEQAEAVSILEGSTLLDYAKEIFSISWPSLISAEVNGKPINQLDYILQQGDVVHLHFDPKRKRRWDPLWIHWFRTDNEGSEKVREEIYKLVEKERKRKSSARWFQVLEVGKLLLSKELNNTLRIGLAEAMDIIQSEFPEISEMDFFFALGMGEVRPEIVKSVADRLRETNLSVLAFNIYFDKDQPGQASSVLEVLKSMDINLAGAQTSSIGETGPTVVNVFLHPMYKDRMEELGKAIRNDASCNQRGLREVIPCAPSL